MLNKQTLGPGENNSHQKIKLYIQALTSSNDGLDNEHHASSENKLKAGQSSEVLFLSVKDGLLRGIPRIKSSGNRNRVAVFAGIFAWGHLPILGDWAGVLTA